MNRSATLTASQEKSMREVPTEAASPALSASQEKLNMSTKAASQEELNMSTQTASQEELNMSNPTTRQENVDMSTPTTCQETTLTPPPASKVKINLSTLTAAQFIRVWDNYDSDGNGFIEDHELDLFLREFISSVANDDQSIEISETEMVSLKESFLEAYDQNNDGKIEIRELAQLLPMEENFLLLFRFDNPLESSVEFMKIWTTYDSDHSGFIEADELKNFLRDILKGASKSQEVTEDNLIEYTSTMLNVFDSNKDGKLQLSEMAKLLPVKENFLTRQIFKGPASINKEDIDSVFALYDRDTSGTIENEELSGFLKDLLSLAKKDYDSSDLTDFEQTIMKGCDTNRDGKISRKELTMILMALSQNDAN